MNCNDLLPSLERPIDCVAHGNPCENESKPSRRRRLRHQPAQDIAPRLEGPQRGAGAGTRNRWPSRTAPFSSAKVRAAGFSGIGTTEYSNKSHSSTYAAPPPRVPVRPARHEADGPPPQHALFEQSEHVLGDGHAPARTWSARPRAPAGCPATRTPRWAGTACDCAPKARRVVQIIVAVPQPRRVHRVAGAVHRIGGGNHAPHPHPRASTSRVVCAACVWLSAPLARERMAARGCDAVVAESS